MSPNLQRGDAEAPEGLLQRDLVGSELEDHLELAPREDGAPARGPGEAEGEGEGLG